jgi:hypothetical protein
MEIKLKFVVAAMILLPASSCIDNLTCIEGDGIIKNERRRLTNFAQIENSTEFDIIFKIADTTGLNIIADRNLLDNVVTDVSGQVLEIRTNPGNECFSYSQRPVIEVSSPYLNSVTLSGSGDFLADQLEGDLVSVKLSGSGEIKAEHVQCDNLNTFLSGSGNISLTDTRSTNSDAFISGSGDILIEGECNKSTLKISGSGNINADKYLAKTGSVTISGSGDSYVYLTDKLTGAISGSGNIYLKGNPLIDVMVSGSGRVIRN